MSGLALPYAGTHPITQGFLGTYYDPNTGIGEAPGFVKPDRLQGKRTNPGGWTYHPHIHLAQDVGMGVGTNLLAPCKAELVAAGTYVSTGEHYAMLRIHLDPSLQTLVFYTHLEAGGILVPVGTHLAAGQHFAESGASGHAAGPHLHWEVRLGAADLDPHLSGSWRKIDPAACLVGGHLASSAWLIPNV